MHTSILVYNDVKNVVFYIDTAPSLREIETVWQLSGCVMIS